MLLSLWLVHRPPSSTVHMLALRLLHALAGTPAAAWAAAAHAGALYLLTILIPKASTLSVEKVSRWYHILLKNIKRNPRSHSSVG